MAIAALLILGISASAQDGKSIYKKYSDMDGVEAVYISPAMFRLIGRIPDINIGDDKVNLASVIKSMNGLYILNTSDPKIGDGFRYGLFRRAHDVYNGMQAYQQYEHQRCGHDGK